MEKAKLPRSEWILKHHHSPSLWVSLCAHDGFNSQLSSQYDCMENVPMFTKSAWQLFQFDFYQSYNLLFLINNTLTFTIVPHFSCLSTKSISYRFRFAWSRCFTSHQWYWIPSSHNNNNCVLLTLTFIFLALSMCSSLYTEYRSLPIPTAAFDRRRAILSPSCLATERRTLEHSCLSVGLSAGTLYVHNSSQIPVSHFSFLTSFCSPESRHTSTASFTE